MNLIGQSPGQYHILDQISEVCGIKRQFLLLSLEQS